MRISFILLALAPAAAQCGNVVTNATDLVKCLGHDGVADVEFSLDATIVRLAPPFYAARTYYLKTADGYVSVEDDVYWPKTVVRKGDMVHIHGKTSRWSKTADDEGYFIAECLEMEIVGHAEPEPPIDADIADVIAGRYPFRPLRIRGTVRDVFTDEIDHLYRHMIISSGERSLGISVPVGKSDSDGLFGLVGAEVRATGCYFPYAKGFRRLGMRELHLCGESDLEVVLPPPEDPFSAPTVESIKKDDVLAMMTMGRHTARGTVIAVWRQGDFAIRTEDGGIVNVSLANASIHPACGASVEAAGLPDTDLYRINLRRAIWRERKGVPPRGREEAVPTEAAAIFTDSHGNEDINPGFHGKAISLRGKVVGMPSQGVNDGIVRILCGNFCVTVDSWATPQAVKPLEPGCEAEISGTCIVKVDSWRPNEPLPRTREVVLVVRAPSDVKVLSLPPWWTPGRLAILVAALVAALAAFLLWNVLLRRLADKRGRELMHSRLSQEESKLKIQERTRIAVELHDTIAQNLTGVSLELDSAEQLARKDTDEMLGHLGMAARTLQSCRNELRNCLWDLRSRALEESDLNEAIRRTVAPLVSDVNLAIRFNVQRKALADDTAHVLMRIVRELVMNAVFHGKASSVKIAGSLDGGVLRFSVCDDGCGFDPASCPGVMQGHFGLQGVRERVNQFNGVMHVDSAPGKGAKINVELKMGNGAHQ